MANYLYNGVELPALPTVRHCDDLGLGLDYAMIREEHSIYELEPSCRAYFVPGQLMRKENSSGNPYIGVAEESGLTSFCYVIYTYKNGEWVEEADTHKSYVPHFNVESTVLTWDYNGLDKTIWSSHPIYNEDGSLYLDGSDPVPVSTTLNPDPTSMTMGWLVGRAIARQRKKQTQEPAGVLISSDGYILRDCNGLYLIAKEDS